MLSNHDSNILGAKVQNALKNRKWLVLRYVTPRKRIREQRVSNHLFIYCFLFFNLLFGLDFEFALGLTLGLELGLG